MAIKVINAGALTSVQDLGRKGLLQFGIPTCGVMDENSYRLANKLCGNDENAAALELTLFGGTYSFTEDCTIAITGADMQPKLDGNEVEENTALSIYAGSTLELGMAQTGCRAYLAIWGGIDVPLVMGSRSTDMKSKLGGFYGRKLQAGDVLPVGKTGKMVYASEINVKALKIESPAIIHAILGPQDAYFSNEGKKNFFESVYTLSGECDRMGYRLEGLPIEMEKRVDKDGKILQSSDIISDGIVFGSVQVPSSGLPIILMADHQTAGGYAKIATVCSFDLPILAQLKPGDKIRFKEISVQDAQLMLKERKK